MKQRLDSLLTERGLFESKTKAQAAIMAGQILVNEVKIDKPGTAVANTAVIRIIGEKLRYVSRGGLKLEKAITAFDLNLQDKVLADIGASTGGFTDCALQNGAAKVYCIDVGYGQLAWKLRTDPRVVNFERTNIRNVDSTALGTKVDGATIDVAFISLDKVLPSVKTLLTDNAFVIALIKPQFEAGKENVGKKGVVKDPAIHIQVIKNVLVIATELGFSVAGLDYSPVKGPEGNIEYLAYLKLGSESDNTYTYSVEDIVTASHSVLDQRG